MAHFIEKASRTARCQFCAEWHKTRLTTPARSAAGRILCHNFLDPEKLAETLGLPENEEVLMVTDLGYAAEGAGPLPNYSSRKPLDETISYL